MDRLAANDYFREAMTILANSGPEALTISALCDSFMVTKGSFYHHFDGMPGFVTRLLAFWETEHSERLIRLSADEPDPVRRVPLLTEIAVSLPHDTEAAFRAWARSNPEVGVVQRRVDARRQKHLVQAFRALGHDRPQAQLLAQMAMAVLVGVQQLQHPVERLVLRQMLERLNELVLSGLPDEAVQALASSRSAS
ncbi:MAG: TetR/AcrR family transcriptional regulator [Mycobacteriales bacterium]